MPISPEKINRDYVTAQPATTVRELLALTPDPATRSWAYVVVPLARGQYAVARMNEVAQAWVTLGDALLDTALDQIPGLLRPGQAIQASASDTEASTLAAGNPRHRMPVLDGERVVGVVDLGPRQSAPLAVNLWKRAAGEAEHYRWPYDQPPLSDNLILVDRHSSMAELLARLRAHAKEWVYLVIPWDEGKYRVMLASTTALPELAERRGEVGSILPLPAAEAGLAEGSVPWAEARQRVQDAAGNRLVILRDGQPIGVLAELPREGIPSVRGFFGISRMEAGLPETRRAEVRPPATRRYLQGQLYEKQDGTEQRAERALRAGALHRLVVRIGPRDEQWLTAAKEAAFPEEELPWKEDQERLQVVFSEPNHAPEPQVGTIVLPRAGPSSTCEFQFHTRTDVPSFEGRIAVLYGNRVLQTALLSGQVVADPVQAAEQPPLKLMEIESVLHKSYGDLASRTPYDAAFIADRDENGETRLTTIAEERATFSLPDVGDVSREILELLTASVTQGQEPGRSLRDRQDVVDLLRTLALHGRALYDSIVTDQVGKDRLKDIQRIQLVSARDQYLPLEFLYDRPPPKETAGLCPHAEQALRDGACVDCLGRNETPAEYVCPLGFWCLRLVIERHDIDAAHRPDLQGEEFALESEPTAERKALPVLRSAVYAASTRVDAAGQDQTQRVFAALQDATDDHAVQAKTWPEWVEAVRDQQPSLLLLLPHTSRSEESNVPQLEIGQAQALLQVYITAEYVHSPSQTAPPVALLLGCETLAPDVPFWNFAKPFRRHKAAIVLLTLTPVLGRHAAPVAARLLDELRQAAQAQESFGDALLSLRRRELAAGLATVLCLVAYGDADWRLAA